MEHTREKFSKFVTTSKFYPYLQSENFPIIIILHYPVVLQNLPTIVRGDGKKRRRVTNFFVDRSSDMVGVGETALSHNFLNRFQSFPRQRNRQTLAGWRVTTQQAAACSASAKFLRVRLVVHRFFLVDNTCMRLQYVYLTLRQLLWLVI